MRRPGGPVSIVALAGAFFLLIWSGPRLKVPDATPAASQDYCGELSPQLQFTLQPTGPTCCWKLSVQNNLPSSFSLQPTLTLTANFPFMGMTLAPGWAFASPPTFPTPGPITLNYTAGSSIPSGTTTIGTFCLNFFNNTTGTLTIQWMVERLHVFHHPEPHLPTGLLALRHEMRGSEPKRQMRRKRPRAA
jgi:hypothetical protein